MSAAAVLPFLAGQSWFSLMSGSPDLARLAEQVRAAGFGSLGLLDEGNLYGLPEFINQAARVGLQALAGARLALPSGGCLYVWARNREGFSRLCALLAAGLAGRMAHDERLWQAGRRRQGDQANQAVGPASRANGLRCGGRLAGRRLGRTVGGLR
ncbi:MAG: hypothetical protein A2Y35_04710 [Spirochaetes bacterium GWE1_60_18]|nr:MAG: hypothetical protein A2Y35_04710 [Spirochaetes bacterium GWE1_60_18]